MELLTYNKLPRKYRIAVMRQFIDKIKLQEKIGCYIISRPRRMKMFQAFVDDQAFGKVGDNYYMVDFTKIH